PLICGGVGGGTQGGGGGPIFVPAGGAASFGNIDASAGPNGYFGSVSLTAGGPITVDGPVDMTGGAWSGSDDLQIRSNGDDVTVNGMINLSVTLPEEAAGAGGRHRRHRTGEGEGVARGGGRPPHRY